MTIPSKLFYFVGCAHQESRADWRRSRPKQVPSRPNLRIRTLVVVFALVVRSNIGDLMLKRGMTEIGTVELSASRRRCEAVVAYAGRAEKAQRALKKGGARGGGSMSLPGLSSFYPAIPHVDHAMRVRCHLLIMRDHEDGLTQTLIQVLQHHHHNM